jgi:hypothetical protein
MTENEISEIADDAASLRNALLGRGFGTAEAVELTRASMPVIIGTVLRGGGLVLAAGG